jgi:hypothetical protein
MFMFGISFAIYERFLEDQASKSPDLDAKVLVLATPRYLINPSLQITLTIIIKS